MSVITSGKDVSPTSVELLTTRRTEFHRDSGCHICPCLYGELPRDPSAGNTPRTETGRACRSRTQAERRPRPMAVGLRSVTEMNDNDTRLVSSRPPGSGVQAGKAPAQATWAQPLWSPGPRVPAHVGQTCHPGDKANAVNLKFPLFILFLSHSHILPGSLRTVSTCVPETGLYLLHLLSLVKKYLTRGLRTAVLFCS